LALILFTKKTEKAMAKNLLISFFSLLLLAATAATAQAAKPKLAVFVVGMDDWKRGDVVAHIVGEELNRDKTYQVVTRSGAVQAKLKALRRASGNVDGCALRAWCKAHGVEHLCLITSSDNQNFSARLFDMTTTPLTQMCSGYNLIEGFGAVDLKGLAWALTTQLRSGSSPCSTYREPSVGLDMVYVEGNSGIKDFWIGKYEVTQGQWEAVMGVTFLEHCANLKITSFYGVGSDYPMYWVSCYEAYNFCAKLSALTGKKYQLPTEEQWQFAARGGNSCSSKGYTYSGSGNAGSVAWYYNNSSVDGKRQAHPVGTKAGNELGIHDMSGNVWEWCGSGFSDSKKLLPSTDRSDRLVRGGAWSEIEKIIRPTYRGSDGPGERYNNEGFRVV
jgi:formylglycine-generating enzyme required for sulfatase activity